MSDSDRASAVFRKEGEYWTIARDGRLIRLRDSKGLGYLSRLLRAPNDRFPVNELVAEMRGMRAETPGSLVGLDGERQRVMVTKAIRTALRKIAEHDPVLGGPLQSAVRTGRVCSYVPTDGCPDRWEE